ncbi:MAG TPA: hypothetical protein VJN93_13590 [Candidatus Acidoferrum sp.]|nr:hypothetical protein [Candidatus Acidoferrum sp.]
MPLWCEIAVGYVIGRILIHLLKWTANMYLGAKGWREFYFPSDERPFGL